MKSIARWLAMRRLTRAIKAVRNLGLSDAINAEAFKYIAEAESYLRAARQLVRQSNKTNSPTPTPTPNQT